MERLWTPWRMSYVTGTAESPVGGRPAPAKQSPCFLCAYAADGPERDAEHLILYRAELGFVLLNLYPYNSGHVMVAPYGHVGDIADLEPAVGHALFDLTQRAVAALRAEYHPDGFNVGLNLRRAAGAGLPEHLHVHVVPRWIGDTNFMAVLGETKVLPEALDQTWARLHRHFT